MINNNGNNKSLVKHTPLICNGAQHAVWKASLTPRLRHRKQKMTTIMTINSDRRKQDLHYTHTHTYRTHASTHTCALSWNNLGKKVEGTASSLAHIKSCGRVDLREPEMILPLPYRPVPPQHSLWRNQDCPQRKCHSLQRLKDTYWYLTAEHKQQCAHVQILGVTEPCIIIVLWPLMNTWIYIYIISELNIPRTSELHTSLIFAGPQKPVTHHWRGDLRQMQTVFGILFSVLS